MIMDRRWKGHAWPSFESEAGTGSRSDARIATRTSETSIEPEWMEMWKLKNSNRLTSTGEFNYDYYALR